MKNELEKSAQQTVTRIGLQQMIAAENSEEEAAVSEILLIESVDEIQIERHANGRGWAIWVGDRLLGIAANRKSAVAIRDSLLMLRARLRLLCEL